MKKSFTYLLIIASILIMGSIKVNADTSYWGNHFKNVPIQPDGLCGATSGGRYGLVEWESFSQKHLIGFGGCGEAQDELKFYPNFLSEGLIFNDAANLQAVSSDTAIITTEVKAYDFSKEQAAYNDYLTWFNGLTLAKFNEIMKGYNPDAEELTVKPTWWEYSELDSEPATWWEAYGFTAAPTNSFEVLSYAKNIGKANITLTADAKSPITIDWTIWPAEYGKATARTVHGEAGADGLAEVLNNMPKYQSLIDEYNPNGFTYYLSENDDLSGLLNALKGKDINVQFVNLSANSMYTLNGKDIAKTVGTGFNYNHTISSATSVQKENIDKVISLDNAIYIDFDYHGELPTTFKLQINVYEHFASLYVEEYKCDAISEAKGWDSEEATTCYENARKATEEFLKNNTFTLLYYNPETKKIEVKKENLKAKDDYIIELEFDHFSSYVLTTNYSVKPVTTPLNNPQTGVPSLMLYGTIAAISGAGLIFTIKRKKKDTA